MPRVGIGLPVYNGENFIKAAIDSVLAQSFKDFELIISDNASRDRTQEICQSYAQRDKRVRYYCNSQNIGAAPNYNRVFELSTAEYFKWIAHDDVIAPTYLERCVDVMDREPNVAVCFPAITYIDAQGKVLQQQQKGNLSIRGASAADRSREMVNHQLESTDIFWAIFGMMRSSALRQTPLHGSYVASDQVLLIQMLLLGEFYQVPEPLYFRRDHQLASMTKHRTPQERQKWFDTQKKKRIILPNWNLLFQYLNSVKRAPLTSSTKLRCYYEVFRRFTNEWRNLAGEFKLVAAQIAGRPESA